MCCIERLWQFALCQAPDIDLLVANLPIRQGSHTLGELDLLLRDRDGERADILMRSHIMANARAISEVLPRPFFQAIERNPEGSSNWK